MGKATLKGKTVLVTGGTGTIGTALIPLLLGQPIIAQQVRTYSRTEWREFEFRERIGDDPRILQYLGDIRNRDRLQMAMMGADVVYHLASLRHIAYCDRNVSEAVSINAVPGVTNVIDLAPICGVKRVIFTSTAEAVYPSNVYGTSKLQAERLMWRAHQQHYPACEFVCVRFGNVLGGKGSIIPALPIRMLNGHQIELYHKDMARRVMTISQAANMLVAALQTPSGSILIPTLPLAFIRDIIDICGELLDITPNVRITKPRKGEKMVNGLYADEEADLLKRHEDYYFIDRAMPPVNPAEWITHDRLSREQLTRMLKGVLNECIANGAITRTGEV